MVFIDGIVGHAGIEGSQLAILLFGHHGVHEEAAGIAFHLRVGQFGIADVDDALAQLGSGGLKDAFPLELRADVAIVELGGELSFQTVGDVGDDVTVAPLVLEAALPVAVVAVRRVQHLPEAISTPSTVSMMSLASAP